MAAYNKFNVFTQDLVKGFHVFQTHAYKFMLTDVAPVATNAVKTDITDIAAGSGYTAGGTATTITIANTSGVEKVTASAVTFTASGAVGPFRYVVCYNDTQTTPVKPLVGWYDYGSEVTLANAQTFTITPDQTNGMFTVT